MDALTISAASGLRSRMDSLEMLANNLANATTGGFKTDREFYSLYSSPEAEDPSAAVTTGTLPVVQKRWTDFSQGLLLPTGNQLDFALQGKGFFVAQSSSGPVYTRNGNFRLAGGGQLVTAEGYPLQLTNGRKLQVDPAQPLVVSTDGTLMQDGQSLGTLQIVNFAEPSALSKLGNNYFQNPDPKIKPGAAPAIEVHQSKLEGSNVSVAESAVRLVGIMRQFEMLQKAISLATDMNRSAVEEVAKVGS